MILCYAKKLMVACVVAACASGAKAQVYDGQTTGAMQFGSWVSAYVTHGEDCVRKPDELHNDGLLMPPMSWSTNGRIKELRAARR